jgi:hypothetical protein
MAERICKILYNQISDDYKTENNEEKMTRHKIFHIFNKKRGQYEILYQVFLHSLAAFS